MGGAISSPFEHLSTKSQPQSYSDEDLQFYTELHYKSYGLCSVYISTKFPSCFVIKTITPITQKSQLDIYSRVQNHQNIFLLSLYGFRLIKNCHCSAQETVSQGATCFWEYLPYNLRFAIEERKKMGVRFEQQQLWHIMRACVNGYSAFLKIGVSYNFMPSKIMINQEGRVRLDWMHLKSKSQHTNFIRKFSQIKQHHPLSINSEEYLAPEELLTLSQKQFTTKLNFEKIDAFSLAMTLLQCLTCLDPVAYFYKNSQIQYGQINQCLSSQYCQMYSKEIKTMIGSMLRENPRQRPSLSQIQSTFSFKLNMAKQFSIKIPKYTTKNEPLLLSIPSQNIYSSIQNNNKHKY